MRVYICAFIFALVIGFSALLSATPASRTTLDGISKEVSAREKMAQDKVKALSQQVFQEIISQLQKGKEVNIQGFGTFHVTIKKSRTWKNPKTKKILQIPPRKTLRFRPSQKLKAALNSSGKKS